MAANDASRPSADRHFAALRLVLLVLRAGPALILLLLVIGISATTPLFATSHNLGNVLAQTAVIAVLAMGQLLVIVTRGIDLSVGSTLALAVGGRGAGLQPRRLGPAGDPRDARRPAPPSAPSTAASSCGAALPHPFIVTLATLSIARGLALWLSGGQPISGHAAVRAARSAAARSAGCPYSAFLVAGIALAAR